jgi:tripartite-type tricarboxylate transporter receptor subunit TctC
VRTSASARVKARAAEVAPKTNANPKASLRIKPSQRTALFPAKPSAAIHKWRDSRGPASVPHNIGLKLRSRKGQQPEIRTLSAIYVPIPPNDFRAEAGYSWKKEKKKLFREGGPKPVRLRVIVLTLALAAAFAPTATQAQSDAYPNRPIRLVVGFAAGGGNDLIARIVAQELQNELGQSVVVENKPGAGGRLAAEYVAGQAPDGYTLLIGASGAMAISPAITDKLRYGTLRDFAPVSMLAAFPLLMVVGVDHPAKTVKDFVAWAKANPEKSNYATSSAAFTLATELFKLKSGIPAVGIPYKSGNEMVLGVLGGNAAMAIVDPPPASEQVKAGKARALAVTAATRLEDLPDVPTMDEAGYPEVHIALWSGVFAPKQTPSAIVAKLEGELRKIMQLTDVKQKFRAMATGTVGSTSQEFTEVITREIIMWNGVAKAADLHLE